MTDKLTAAEIRLGQYADRSTWTNATYSSGNEKALHEIALGLKAEIDRLRDAPPMVCINCETPVGWVDCPTGGWWAHETHPEDGHDADPKPATMHDTVQPPTVALPASWECANGPSDDEPFCAEAEDDSHVCPTIRVHPDDAEKFAGLVDEVHRLRVLATTARVDAFREAAGIAEDLRQFEPAFGVRRSAQVSENVGILRVAEELRRRAAGKADGAEPDGETVCSFGEAEAPGSGCILSVGHEPANRHIVTPGDVDLDD